MRHSITQDSVGRRLWYEGPGAHPVNARCPCASRKGGHYTKGNVAMGRREIPAYGPPCPAARTTDQGLLGSFAARSPSASSTT
jgi:hypothetical protein